mmetsp:Transcript_23213/g.36303  ORF Transcript_23213/g.36303 Transcript_23213/m.36303 type:complete len:354 (-) Transcript_23213:360-1421(-)
MSIRHAFAGWFDTVKRYGTHLSTASLCSYYDPNEYSAPETAAASASSPAGPSHAAGPVGYQEDAVASTADSVVVQADAVRTPQKKLWGPGKRLAAPSHGWYKDSRFDWQFYIEFTGRQPVHSSFFTHSSNKHYLDILGANAAAPPADMASLVGKLLEAKDVRNPGIIAVATIKAVHKDGDVTVYFDGWSEKWNYKAPLCSEHLHPVGWYEFQKPGGLAAALKLHCNQAANHEPECACSHCGEVFVEGQIPSFCPQCGKSQTPHAFCSECGEKLLSDRSNFCQACGVSVSIPDSEVLRLAHQDSDSKLCVICLDRESTHAFVPCGHKCVCKAHSHCSKCPVCRKPVQNSIRVYG